jgi:hypothetical protein
MDGRESTVVELRRYTLQSGARETLIELFERELVEPQEAVGMELIGTFRDVERDDRFVWLRGFADLPARDTALRAFYGGPVWAANRDAANATMIDSDDVYLLRPVDVDVPQTSGTGGELAATIYHLERPATDGFLDRFRTEIAPRLVAAGAAIDRVFVTEPGENTFPALPVWEDRQVLVWLGRLPGRPVDDPPGVPSPAERVLLEPTRRSRTR